MKTSLLRLLVLLAWMLLGATGFARENNTFAGESGIAAMSRAELPTEARKTLNLIHHNGPFPYDRDGIEFRNFEKRLPRAQRGYYREYSVQTPGERNRGTRRIITGGDPVEVYYYTDDHYRSFRRIQD